MSNQNSTVLSQELSESPSPDEPDKILLKQEIDTWLKHEFSKTEFTELVKAVFSEDRSQQIYGAIGIRKLLSEGENPPIEEAINANLVPRFIQFMQNDQNHHLQLEAIWALTNIAAGTTQQTQTIIHNGGIPILVRLLRSSSQEIAEQAVWAIGNIAGDSAVFRDMILQSGALEPLLHIVDHSIKEDVIISGVGAISNLCRGKPLPKFSQVMNAIPTLCKVIKTSTNAEVLKDAAKSLYSLSSIESNWAMYYPSKHSSLAEEAIPVLIKYIDAPTQVIALQCLRTLGNITMSNTAQNLALSLPDYLPKLIKLASYGSTTKIQQVACWMISNITAGDSNQIEAVMKNPHYVDMLLRLTTSPRENIQLESTYIFSNATKKATLQQLAEMINLGVLDCLMHALSSESEKIIVLAAEGLLNILNEGATAAVRERKSNNDFLEMLIDKGGIEKLEDLQSHTDDEVYKIVMKILERHFELERVK